MEYVNDYMVQVLVEGREYNGYLQGISFQKSAVQQFLYQYSLSFAVLSDRLVYTTQDALKSGRIVNSFSVQNAPTGAVITESIYTLLNG
jgi:hypothetical protein